MKFLMPGNERSHGETFPSHCQNEVRGKSLKANVNGTELTNIF